MAIDPLGQARPAWKLTAALGVRLGVPVPYKSLEELRAALSGGSPKSKRPSLSGAAQ